MTMLTSEMRKLLEFLLGKYERSKTCFDKNKVNQRFVCKPNEIYSDYYSDYLDIDIKEQYDAQIAELENEGYIRAERKNGDVILISMVNEMYDRYCSLLGVSAVCDKLAEQMAVLEKYRESCSLLERICSDQLERLSANKDNTISADIRELEKILECIVFIVGNTSEILERELSIEVFADSKLFEKYRVKICSLLLRYEPDICGDDDAKEVQREKILSYHSIVKNPTYIYFKGRGKISFGSSYAIDLTPAVPIAINSRSLSEISDITVTGSRIITVENLTSFNRMESSDAFLLYLSGYSNTAKNAFLRLVRNCNQDKEWLHFGDIDPDGFYILENLRNKTDIDFQPFYMGIGELKKYMRFTKPLERNDVRKAESLKKSRYSDVVRFMLDHNCKLEQEIISWKDHV